MANIKHVVSATSSALVTSVGTVGNLFEWASVHSNEALERSRIETQESRKPWAAELMLNTQKTLATTATELSNLGFTQEEIQEETFRIMELFNKK